MRAGSQREPAAFLEEKGPAISDDAGPFCFPLNEDTNMRYEACWSNGYWKTFDRVRFADVETHPTQRIAVDAVAAKNRAQRK
jgi:hypothetical protein